MVGARRFVTLASVGVLLALTGGAVAAPAADTVVVALNEDIRGADPRRERDGLTDPVHMHIIEGLVGIRDDLEVGPMLAEKWEVRDDGRTYVFTLRDGVPFHNGEKVTAEAVKWSWEYLTAADSLWRCKPVMTGQGPAKVEAVEAPDARTVVFRLDKPNAGFLYTMARPDCGSTPVFHPKSLNADGSWNKVIGTGPFTLADRRIGEFAEIRRFADYAARTDPPTGLVGSKRPLVDKVRFMVVSDDSTRQLALQSGDIDIATLQAQAAKELAANPKLDIVTAETTVWYALLLNQNDPLLKDKRLRQAIAAAIDRDAVAEAVTYGQSKGSNSPMPRLSRYYSAMQAGNTAAEPQRAKSLLKAAGYTGQPITITANKRFSLMYDDAVIIQSMLQAVGINATIEVVEWGLQLDRYVKGNYQSQSFGYSGRYEPLGAWDRIIGPESNKIWKDPEAITLLKSAADTDDKAKIQQISDRLYRKFIDEVPAVGLYLVTVNFGVTKRIQGLKPSPIEYARLWNVTIGK